VEFHNIKQDCACVQGYTPPALLYMKHLSETPVTEIGGEPLLDTGMRCLWPQTQRAAVWTSLRLARDNGGWRGLWRVQNV